MEDYVKQYNDFPLVQKYHNKPLQESSGDRRGVGRSDCAERRAEVLQAPGSVHFLAPNTGEHHKEIYCGELGYSKERLQQLRESGII